MSSPVNSITDVVAAQLCTGCGVCAYVESKRFRMADTLEYGRRPFLREGAALESGEAIAVCPGARIERTRQAQKGALPEFHDAWGPVLAVWEGYAADNEIRFAGSSGGAATALALYCIEKDKMSGALHVGARKGLPCLNETVYSTSRADLLACAGSRYAPTSPCDGLERLEDAEVVACVFIGKPCDVVAVQNARRLRPLLDKKLGLVIAFFCAGVPSTKGTLDLLKANGVDPATVEDLRYRGNGWPGLWNACFRDPQGWDAVKQMTYAESWGFLQKYRQWRCYICPDHSGEFADIAVGDPWYRQVQEGEPGKSLIVARTQRGLEFIKAAQEAGYLVLETNDPTLLPRSQPNLLTARGELWARLRILRIFGAAVPRYSGFVMFRFWLSELSLIEKIRSVTGTAKRIFTKRLNTPIKVSEWQFGRKP